MKKKILRNIAFFGIVTLIFISCTNKKNTVLTRSYHNLTSHYNVYFNGREGLKKGVKTINTTVKDDYMAVLPLFAYENEASSKSVFPDMDLAITKGSKAVKIHSITEKPKGGRGKKSAKQKAFFEKTEYCNWIDDSYLMMGRAHFYKHDFQPAEDVFSYIIGQYKESDLKFDAMLWLARTYNQEKKYSKAIEVLEQAQGNKDFPSRLKSDLSAIYADNYLKQKKYEDAQSYLITAIDLSKKKKEKVRYCFVMAQLYERSNQPNKASEMYAQVIKLTPTYEMSFNAKINRASLYDVNSGQGKEIKRQLAKMLKDEKNIEYKDQIYYALGNIEKAEGNIEKAISYYKESVKNSVSNTNQKAISYLAIADIYYSQPNYQQAQAFYDSTMAYLNVNYAGYQKISEKSKDLTELVKNLNIVEREDSLQKVAQMSLSDRNKLIDNIIEALKKEEERLRIAQQEEQLNTAIFNQNNQSNQNNNNNTGGKWYFYNPATVALGQAEFTRKWGRRAFEDNWRRKNKAVVAIEQTANDDNVLSPDSTSATASTQNTAASNNKSRAYYLKEIPVNDSLIKVSNAKIEEALFNVGYIYKERFNNCEKSIKTYEEFNTRFPKSELTLLSYYDQYICCKLINNNKSDKYKNLIVNNYPDSKYAKILTNPNYFNELEKEAASVNALYTQTYNLFSNRDYFAVLKNCNYADSTYSTSNIIQKFKYLKTFAIGRTQGLEAFKASLKTLADNYSTDEVGKSAKEVLAFIQVGTYENIASYTPANKTNTNNSSNRTNNNTAITTNQQNNTQQNNNTTTNTQINNTPTVVVEPELYTFKDTLHYYIVIVDGKAVDVNKVKFTISNFNFDFYSMIDFNIQSIILNGDVQMISIKPFENKEKALSYFESIALNPDVFKEFKASDYRHFVISANNYITLFRDKDVGKYLKFYEKNYVTK